MLKQSVSHNSANIFIFFFLALLNVLLLNCDDILFVIARYVTEADSMLGFIFRQGTVCLTDI